MIENTYTRSWVNFAMLFTALQQANCRFYLNFGKRTELEVPFPEDIWKTHETVTCKLSHELFLIEILKFEDCIKLIPVLRKHNLPHFWNNNRLSVIVEDVYWGRRIQTNKEYHEFQRTLLFGIQVNVCKSVPFEFAGSSCFGWYMKNVTDLDVTNLDAFDKVMYESRIPRSFLRATRENYDLYNDDDNKFHKKMRREFSFESTVTGYTRHYLLMNLAYFAYEPHHVMVDYMAGEEYLAAHPDELSSPFDYSAAEFLNENRNELVKYLILCNDIFCVPKLNEEELNSIVSRAMNKRGAPFQKWFRTEKAK